MNEIAHIPLRFAVCRSLYLFGCRDSTHVARSRIIRHSAGVFIGTFLFALIALSTVDRQTNGMVPALTTIVASVSYTHLTLPTSDLV